MSKKKKVPKRPHTLPKDYLIALADKLHRMNPSKAIIFNTLRSLYCKGFTEGYLDSRADQSWFKARQEQHIKESWDKEKDKLDDLIHTKS
jgi:hypothetical protein